jgi:Asparagine synthase
MSLKVNNRYNKYVYFDKESCLLHENIWDVLTLNRIRKANLSAHDFNTSLFVDRPDLYKEVIPGIIPIPPRSRWLYDGQSFISCNSASISKHQKADFDKLINTCRRLLGVIKKVPIAVDLSGGLDTSIIIGLIEQCNIRPFLLGFKNSRYEFRTELAVQNIYTNKFETALLLDNEEHLPFSSLTKTPIHQLPSSISLSHSMANQLALKYKENGIRIVFNGMGADTLLCDCPLQNGDQRHPESWFPWMIDNNWLNEYVFNAYGIEYRPAVASRLLVHLIWQMRKKEQEDFKKIWARRLFSKYLPTELVNYTYKADFSGLYLDGLWNATNEISEIFKVAHDITKYEEFKQSSLNNLLNNVQKNDDEQEKLIRSRISFANWIYGLARDKFN